MAATMHKDPNLRKRNALVIPGGLLALVALAGMLYVVGLRSDAGTCEDSSLIVFAGACRSAVLLLAIPLVIGLTLLAVGALKFRNKATCRQGWGSWAHFGLALLITLVVVPAVAALATPSLLGEDAVIVSGGVNYRITNLMAGLAGVGLIALVPFTALYVGRNQANRCCHDNGCFDPCFCDEPIAPADAEAPPLAAPTPLPEQELLPPPEPAPEPAADAWTEAPPADEWEVVPDEPAPEPAPAPEPMPEPVPQPAPEPAPEPEPEPRKAAADTPRLASRPGEDPEAIKAKWAEEDAEAARELREAGSDPPARAARRSFLSRKAPAKKPAKPAKRPAKKPAKKKVR